MGSSPQKERIPDPLIAGYMVVGRRPEPVFASTAICFSDGRPPLFGDFSDEVRRRHRAACWLSDLGVGASTPTIAPSKPSSEA